MSDKIPIEQSYGYWIINTPELKAKYGPKQLGDEFQSFTCDWARLSASVGQGFLESEIYRRRIPVGEGFELVGLDGVIQEGDEAFIYGTWQNQSWYCYQRDEWTPKRIAQSGRADDILAFRRKKQSKEVTDGWVKIGDRLPKADEYPVWVTDGSRVEQACEPYSLYPVDLIGKPKGFCTSTDWDASIAHWMPKPKAVKPLPPAPVKSAEEIAFEKVRQEVRAEYEAECRERGFDVIESPSALERGRRIWNAAIAFKEGK